MNYEDNPASIKYYVKKYLIENQQFFKNKKVVDFPAGNGVTSAILKDIGAVPVPLDLFPEYFSIDELSCERANISEGLPLDSENCDAIICQEGIEHFSDQIGAFKEFSRVLKKDGLLLITTPNYSNLRSKLSYLIGESERFNSMLAPNELDDIWMSEQDISAEIYYGHLFLIGIQKLRTYAKLSGFSIKQLHFTKAKSTSVLLMPVFYPFIWLFNWIAYRKNLQKRKPADQEVRKVYREIFKLSTNPKILVGSHLMVEFVKEENPEDVAHRLSSQHKEFGLT
jgi:SAM-dependent methyltransferase